MKLTKKHYIIGGVIAVAVLGYVFKDKIKGLFAKKAEAKK